jgi:hypothetical protein
MTEITIGRKNDCTICLNDLTVSKLHATLVIEGEKCLIKDENSLNGIYVNGTKVNGVQALKENDIVKVGNNIIPWKNYLNIAAQPAPPLVTPGTPPWREPVKKKSTSIAWVVSLIILAGLSLLIVAFFNSTGDELRLNASWQCISANNTLKQLVLKKMIDGSGDYECTTSDSSLIRGVWSLDKNDNTLHIKPGILPGVTGNTEEVYKYNLNRNTLSLTRLENGTTNYELTLVK